MALVGVELETLVSEQDALTTRPPPRNHSLKSRINEISIVIETEFIGGLI